MATYYISTTGDDGTGDGSSGNPWATFAHAYDNSVDTDTINVAAGTYAWVTDDFNNGGRIVVGNDPFDTIFDAGGANISWQFRNGTTWNFSNLQFFDTITNRAFFINSQLNITISFTNCFFKLFAGVGGANQGYFQFGDGIITGVTLSFTSCIFSGFFISSGSPLYLFNFKSGSGNALTMINNTFWETGIGGASIQINRLDFGTGGIFKNNIFRNEGTTVSWGATNAGWTVSNNAFTGFSGTPPDANEVTTDPLLVDPANDNFNLRPTSPCIDTGILI